MAIQLSLPLRTQTSRRKIPVAFVRLNVIHADARYTPLRWLKNIINPSLKISERWLRRRRYGTFWSENTAMKHNALTSMQLSSVLLPFLLVVTMVSVALFGKLGLMGILMLVMLLSIPCNMWLDTLRRK